MSKKNKRQSSGVQENGEPKDEEEKPEETAGEEAAGEEAAGEETGEEETGEEEAAEGEETPPEVSEKEESAADKVPEVDPKDLEIADLKDKWLRTAAEYDNYRKRAAKERLELTPEITARTLTEFLPVMDSLEHALAAQCSDPNYKKGVELIKENFVTALQNLGVEEIVSDGEPFNPAYHQAVQQVEKEGAESGTVAATFQKGYRIGDRVLRFAMVSVVK